MRGRRGDSNANAGSAVVTDGHDHLITSYGQPAKEIAKDHALKTARQRYGANVRLSPPAMSLVMAPSRLRARGVVWLTGSHLDARRVQTLNIGQSSYA